MHMALPEHQPRTIRRFLTAHRNIKNQEARHQLQDDLIEHLFFCEKDLIEHLWALHDN